MKIVKIAGIDIGSNAVRLLVNTVIPGETYKDAVLHKTAFLRLPLRLGGDVFLYNEIRAEKEKMFARVMEIYADLLKFYEVDFFRACATSATRDAYNGKEIIQKIKQQTDINIDIIDGYEESLLLYETNKYHLPEGKVFLSADLGGGSFQLTLFEGNNLLWTNSYQIGTVRYLSNTINPEEYIQLNLKLSEIKRKFKNITIIGSGGNINKISKMIGAKYVNLSRLRLLHQKLSSITYEQRVRIYALRPDRADVIVPALEIYISLLEKLGKGRIFVPKTGLADGIIRKLYEEKNI